MPSEPVCRSTMDSRNPKRRNTRRPPRVERGVGNEHATESSGAEVTCAFDEVDGEKSLVVADIGRDDAWLAMSASTCVEVGSWR
ncbi:DUF7556 family protein [Haloprofundus sp. MHR1]|uniref:DUF7556 family protein n=1 Tax=Haloprofundus sp. MHR1 TaxID=2572921 RepID=UPI0010BE7C5E|nr:hypothetical protein [Haloprofundus sp. MHR1]QCJ46587.1 hypothetical protein FCF25_05405 [Haloprofundus sp. MHR1]